MGTTAEKLLRVYMLESVGIAGFAEKMGIERVVSWELAKVMASIVQEALAALRSERIVDEAEIT